MPTFCFRYRARELTTSDIAFIQETIFRHYELGRSYISRVLCQAWGWTQPNGKFKEYAARDLLLRLEEKGFIELPPRLRVKNNSKRKSFAQVPIFLQTPISGAIREYCGISLRLASPDDNYLWDYLVHHHHYLGLPKLVGEHLRYLAFIDEQPAVCLAWASAAWKVQARDQFIGWDESARRKNLPYVVNNTRFLVLPWVRVKCLASKVLALNLRCLQRDWQNTYGHPICLAETFVDSSRFKGTCYQAANWLYAGQTQGSSRRGSGQRYHGRSKAVFLYPLRPHFRRLLSDQG
jgi:hypothetical protein